MPGTTTITTAFPAAGTITIVDTTAVAVDLLTAAVAAQTTFLTSTFAPTPGGKSVLPGSIAQSLYHSKETLAAQSKQLGELNGNIEKLLIAVGKTTTELEKLNKAAGVSNSHANKANCISNLAVIDQMDKNQFDKQVVTETQIAAGQEPTKVVPTAFAANVQKKVSDIVNIDGAMAASGIIISTATTAVTEGFALAQEIVLDTAIGKSLVAYYYEAEIAVTKLFSAKRAERLVAENKERLKAIESGGAPAPPTAPVEAPVTYIV